ncbi:MAG TPA: DNA polymerase III subunit delta, partial [Pirellulaceae bacterium]|nr:DNA polymerase III subunit delta [Pirellulaceae bacterium]
MPTVPAFDYLADPTQFKPAAVNVLFGDEPFLRQLALVELRASLAAGRDDVQITTFDSETPWRDLNDELSTGSLFGGGGRRLVLIEDADAFVSLYRAKLEDYVAKPKSSAALILAVDSWAANTRLYKMVDESGFQIACGVPSRQVGKNKEPDMTRLSKWLIARAKTVHQIALDSSGADELVQIVGANLGLIEQDLAKLALYVPRGGKVNAALVKEVVGGWRLRTAWQMLDDVADGKLAAGLEQLDHLLRSGTEPQAIFGQISWVLRRYAAAARIAQA